MTIKNKRKAKNRDYNNSLRKLQYTWAMAAVKNNWSNPLIHEALKEQASKFNLK